MCSSDLSATKVPFSDPLPDTFVDNSQALVEGRLAPNGTFVADKVQAKCASKYEAARPQGDVGGCSASRVA